MISKETNKDFKKPFPPSISKRINVQREILQIKAVQIELGWNFALFGPSLFILVIWDDREIEIAYSCP